MDFHKIASMSTNPKQAAFGLNESCTSYSVVPSIALLEAGRGLQHILSEAFPSSAKAATNYRSLFSSYEVVPGWAQAAIDLGLH